VKTFLLLHQQQWHPQIMAHIKYRDILVVNVLAVFSGVCARQRYDMFLHKKGCLMGFSSFILFHRRYL
jgi:hypothetical protein